MYNGILWVLNNNDGGYPVMWKGGKCPYCGDKHIHGGSSGHRIGHCSSRPIEMMKPGMKNVIKKEKFRSVIQSPFGPWRERRDGYYWLDRNIKDMGDIFECVVKQVGAEYDAFQSDLSTMLGDLNILRP